jgi:hypothetical protein
MMKTFQKLGGAAALICAATYIVSIGLLVTLLSPFADPDLGFTQFMTFYLDKQAVIFVWHLLMYLVNGVCLVILILALYDRLKAGAPVLAQIGMVFGLIWSALVFASGFITIYGWEVIAGLYGKAPAQAEAIRLALETITTGIDHSDRFLGCLWVLLVSWAALRVGVFPKGLIYFGLLIGVPGIISTVLPAVTELGLLFGMGIILWWAWLGIVLLRRSSGAAAREVEAKNAAAWLGRPGGD